MAKRVVEVNSIFTGSESGSSFLESMTNTQLDVLIKHTWPDPANTEKGSDPLESVIKNIKMEVGHKKSDSEDEIHENAPEQETFDHTEGMENSRHTRLKRVAALGKKLRSEGSPSSPA
jgi:hypothetical protein